MTNSRFKFRAWHKGYPGGRRIRTIEPKMLYENWPGEGLLWKEQGQPVEIMQWTGLIDKNGKPIFEGDIIKVRVNFLFWVYRIGIVEGQGSNLYAIKVYDNCSVNEDTNMYTYEIQTIRAGKWRPIPNDCEVIGNIYQDSHLLEAPQ